MTDTATPPIRHALRLPTRLVCAGCGWHAAANDLAPRCPNATVKGDIDHVISRTLDANRVVFPSGGEVNPFIRYRTLLHGYHRARSAGSTDAEVVAQIQALDAAVERVDGRGFRITPFLPASPLAAATGIQPPATLLVKDETTNVAGSHKGRHLFGIMLELLFAEPDRTHQLAIASSGNAALAAAVIARAADWPLEVFVPQDVEASTMARLADLGATVTICTRRAGQKGDPTYLRLLAAVAEGAIPFTCQGNQNGLAIEGGLTLGYELADALRASKLELEHLFIQVGGGALAASIIQALAEAKQLGALEFMPRIWAVETRNAHPLKRAYDLVRARLSERLGGSPEGALERLRAATTSGSIAAEFEWIANHRSQFMSPWTPAPHSVARGMLDDEAYDWLAVVRGMLGTAGRPVLVDEAELEAANRMAREETGIDVDVTGSAGLAGLLQLRNTDEIWRSETAAVIFTGVGRA